MGAANSNLRRCVEGEFDRLLPLGSDALLLEDILKYRLPITSWCLKTCHLGVLFLLDSNHDGRITRGELLEFLKVARGRARRYHQFQFRVQFEGWCTLQMWKVVKAEGGTQLFIDWMLKLLTAGKETRTFTLEGRPEAGSVIYRSNPVSHRPKAVLCISSESVRMLYHLLNVKDNHNTTFQEFMDLLQCAAEEKGLMNLTDVSQDEWLAVPVVEDLLRNTVKGMKEFMDQIFPEEKADNPD